MISTIFDLQITSMHPTKFLVNHSLSVQEKRQKIGGQLGFPIVTILAILDYKSSQCFLPSFQSVGLSVPEKKPKKDFQDGHHGSHLGFPVETILAIFYLQDTPMLPT